MNQLVSLDLMRDSAKKFPEIASKDEVRGMRVWHCKYKTLEAISAFVNLEELIIGTFPDANLDILATLKKLRYLSILHLPKINRIDTLSVFSGLETLSLATSPSWDASGKFLTVDSLHPIATLSKLKHLELLGVCPPDKSLAQLEDCKGLESARFSKYPQNEVDRFFEKNRAVDQFNPKPYLVRV